MTKRKIDLTGIKYGKWLVIKEAPPRIDKKGHSRRMWDCLCECGTRKNIDQSELTRGRTRSCGCSAIQFANETKQKQFDETTSNSYDLSNQTYGIGFTKTGFQFLFSMEDYDWIKTYHWFHSSGYIYGTLHFGDKKQAMHRLISNAKDDEFVDHRNGIRSDNRRENLRIVDASLNGMNRVTGVNNTSGCPGVYFVKADNKWAALLTVDGKTHSLGRYIHLEDAIAARKAAEEKYFGEYSYDNSQAYAQQYALPEQQITNL